MPLPVSKAQLLSPPVTRTGWPWTEASPALPPKMPNGQPWPKISIVTPAYNQAQFLEETMRSVLLQGYPNLEYIVINDGSTDNTMDVIRRYELWLSHWETQPNSGQPAAINRGFARSTGEIMGFLNSDDLLLPRALERTALARMGKPKVKITCGFRQFIDEHSKVTTAEIHPWPAMFDVVRNCFIAQETVFWNRGVWDNVGRLQNLRYALDFDYWLRAFAAGYEFTLIPHFLGACRIHANCKTVLIQDVYRAEASRIWEHYLGRPMSYSEALNLSTVPRQQPVLRAVQRSGLIRFPGLTARILKLTSQAAWLGFGRGQPALVCTRPLRWAEVQESGATA